MGVNMSEKGVGTANVAALSCSKYIPQMRLKLAQTWNLEARAISKMSKKFRHFCRY